MGGTIGNFFRGNCGPVMKVPISKVSGQMLTTLSPSPPANAITDMPSRYSEPSSIADATQGAPIEAMGLNPFKVRAHNTSVNSGAIKSTSLPTSKDTINTKTSNRNHSQIEPTNNQKTSVSWSSSSQVYNVLNICTKRVTSRFAHLEKFSLIFLRLSFVTRVNLLHPCSFMVYYYLFGVFLS